MSVGFLDNVSFSEHKGATMDDASNERTSEFQPIARKDLPDIGNEVAAIGVLIGRAIIQLRSWWAENGPAVVAGFRKLVDEVPPTYKRAMIELALHGWYVDSKMGLGEPLRFAADLSNSEKINDAKDELRSHFASRLDAIETEVCGAFPHRARILSQASMHIVRANMGAPYRSYWLKRTASATNECKRTISCRQGRARLVLERQPTLPPLSMMVGLRSSSPL